MKTSPVDAHHYPRVWQNIFFPLELSDVFKSDISGSHHFYFLVHSAYFELAMLHFFAALELLSSGRPATNSHQ